MVHVVGVFLTFLVLTGNRCLQWDNPAVTSAGNAWPYKQHCRPHGRLSPSVEYVSNVKPLFV